MLSSFSFGEIIIGSLAIGSVIVFLYEFLTITGKFNPPQTVVNRQANNLSTSTSSKIKFIREYKLPNGIKSKLILNYPGLTDEQFEFGILGLKQFFICHLKAKNKYIAMPSQFVDAVWHEFILYTYQYSAFCDEAFGAYLHHIPDSYDTNPTKKELGMLLVWELSQQDSIGRNVDNALFLVDEKLNLKNSINKEEISVLKKQHRNIFNTDNSAPSSTGFDLLALSLLLQNRELNREEDQGKRNYENSTSGCGSSLLTSQSSNHDLEHGSLGCDTGSSADGDSSSGCGSSSSCGGGGGCGGD